MCVVRVWWCMSMFNHAQTINEPQIWQMPNVIQNDTQNMFRSISGLVWACTWVCIGWGRKFTLHDNLYIWQSWNIIVHQVQSMVMVVREKIPGSQCVPMSAFQRSLGTRLHLSVASSREKGYLLPTWVRKITTCMPTFRLNAPVVIRAMKKKCEQTLLFIAMHYWKSKVGEDCSSLPASSSQRLCSNLKLVTDNLSLYLRLHQYQRLSVWAWSRDLKVNVF